MSVKHPVHPRSPRSPSAALQTPQSGPRRESPATPGNPLAPGDSPSERDQLQRLYVLERLSERDVAQRLGISRQFIGG